MDFNSSMGSFGSQSQPTRYLDVMTTRNSNAKSINNMSTHSVLLVEPVLIPNLSHVAIEPPNEAKQSCLFYPTGEKNTNLLKEVEQTIVKHNKFLLDNSLANKPRLKNKYRRIPEDKYANAKGPPLYYTKGVDQDTKKLIMTMRGTNDKIHSTVQLRL